jgi:hypothetical protein
VLSASDLFASTARRLNYHHITSLLITQVTKMKMISPSNREVDVGKTLSEREWIGMCRREVMDDFLRKRAAKLGAKVGDVLVQ